MTKKATFKGKKQYGTYKSLSKFTINKKRKLERHLKKHPQDAQAVEAKSGITYSRKKPINKLGWLSESVKRFVMITIPYLNGKGDPIVVRHPEQLEKLYHTFGQAIAVTKSNAIAYAQTAKFMSKAPYQKQLVNVGKKGEVVWEWKHIHVPFVKNQTPTLATVTV